MIAAVVLAAGAGRRLGTVAKALLPIGDRTFLGAIAEAGRAAGVSEWLVVVGAPHAAATGAEAGRLGLAAVENPAPERGMASSIACGFAAAAERFAAEAAFLWPVDCPRVAPDTLRALAARADRDGAVVPVWQARGGHPPLIGRALWPELAACAELDEGARSVLRRDPERVARVAVGDPGVVADVDTPDDLP